MWTTGHECEYRTDPTSAWHFETRQPPIETGTPGMTDAAGRVAVAALLAGSAASCLTPERKDSHSTVTSVASQILPTPSDPKETGGGGRNILDSSMLIQPSGSYRNTSISPAITLLFVPCRPSELAFPRLGLSIPIPLHIPHKRPVLQHSHELPSAHPCRF
jgi:hypothetical protein